jgi:hypothetical protein
MLQWLGKNRHPAAKPRKQTLEPMTDITSRPLASQKHGNEAKNGGIPLFEGWLDQIGQASDAVRHFTRAK